MFAVSWDEIATIMGRKPPAARRLASRARSRVRGAEPSADSSGRKQREAVDAFLAAAREGDFELLVGMLDPDVVFRLDAGADSPLARPPVRGAEAVAREIIARGTPFAPLARPALVNGVPGALVGRAGHLVAVANVVVSGARIVEIDIVFDPEKLRHVVIG
jgi:RNA polymerase sigma-70 factor (ECF subfamily)